MPSQLSISEFAWVPMGSRLVLAGDVDELPGRRMRLSGTSQVDDDVAASGAGL